MTFRQSFHTCNVRDSATAPLLSAGGTRIKILEALAAGVPVVATTLGALGLIVGGRVSVIADSPEDFAVAIQRMSPARVGSRSGESSG